MDERSQMTAGQEAPSADADRAISLQPYFDTLARYRAVIAASMAAVGTIFVIAALALWLWSPVERTASIRFRVLFEGATRDKYPNGAPFSPSEIVGTPVVAEVFAANDLKRFGSYEDFKSALFVQQSNPVLDLLTYEYQARLADPRLSPVERGRIEAEFKSKRESMTDPAFAITLRRSERFQILPSVLAEKVLSDVLSVWARQAEATRGVMKYQVPLLTTKTLSRESLERDDYLQSIDQLRSKAVRITTTIGELERVPGVMTLRTSKDGLSLPEIRARLEDTIRYKIEPLMSLIRSEGLAKDPRMLELYVSDMVQRLQREKKEAEARARSLAESLGQYVTQTASRASVEPRGGQAPARPSEGASITPQLSESFLDRLETMSLLNKPGEMEYRRKLTDQIIDENSAVATLDRELTYYEEMKKSLGTVRKGEGSPSLIAQVKSRGAESFTAIEAATAQLTTFYEELSAQTLNPAARLYAITGPFAERKQGALAPDRMVLLLALLLILTAVFTAVGCLVYAGIHPARPLRMPTPHQT